MDNSIRPASPAPISEQQSHSVSDEDWASNAHAVAGASANRTMKQSEAGGAGIVAAASDGDDAYFAHFKRIMNERQPESDAHANILINKVAANVYTDLRRSYLAQGHSEEEAASFADTRSKTFADKCNKTQFDIKPAGPPEGDKIDKKRWSGFPLSIHKLATKPVPKEPKADNASWKSCFRKPKASQQQRAPRGDEEAARLLSIGENIKDATSSPAKESAAWGILAVGIGGILVLPFAVWTVQGLCNRNSPQHDDHGCDLSKVALAGNCLIAFGGIVTGASLCCRQHRRNKHARVLANRPSTAAL